MKVGFTKAIFAGVLSSFFASSVFSATPQAQVDSPKKSESETVSTTNGTNSQGKWFAGLRGGTTGFGGDVGYKFNPTFAVRVFGASFFHEREHLTLENTRYDNVKLKLLLAGLIADWYVFKGGFRISGGLAINGNKIKMQRDVTALPFVTVDGNQVPGFLIGVGSATYRYRKLAPYLGVGYDSENIGGSSISVGLDLGFLFQGKAKAKASVTGAAPLVIPNFNRLYQDYVEHLVNNHRVLRTYPVVSLSVRYTF
jgi:hypothetical protein